MVTRFGHTTSNGARLGVLVLVTIATLFVSTASAQVRLSTAAPVDSTVRSGTADTERVLPDGHRPPQPIRDSLITLDLRPLPASGTARASLQSSADGRKKSVGRRVLGAAVGATAGFFAGGYLGAAIEGDRCHCDDPGLKGALIGAPIGAVTGGVLGGLFLF